MTFLKICKTINAPVANIVGVAVFLPIWVSELVALFVWTHNRTLFIASGTFIGLMTLGILLSLTNMIGNFLVERLERHILLKERH